LGNGKRITKILTIVSIVASLCVYAVIAVSSYTLAVSFSESVMSLQSQEGEELLEMTTDPTGGLILILRFTVHNPGLMEISVTLDLMLLSSGGEVITEGRDSKRIPSGSSDELVVSLYLSPENTVIFETSPSVFNVDFECRTLLDLIGIAISIEIGGEELPSGA